MDRPLSTEEICAAGVASFTAKAPAAASALEQQASSQQIHNTNSAAADQVNITNQFLESVSIQPPTEDQIID